MTRFKRYATMGFHNFLVNFAGTNFSSTDFNHFCAWFVWAEHLSLTIFPYQASIGLIEIKKEKYLPFSFHETN